MPHSLPSPSCALPVARTSELTAWLARAKPGERLRYHRGLLALDRVKGTTSLKEAERRRLAAVARHLAPTSSSPTKA
jgi:hypothetical protein